VKIVAVSMVRNESDVLEAFVRHHAELVDELVIVDHRSIDGSRELLHELEREGLPLTCRVEGSLVQRQWEVLTDAMRQAADGGADWIVPLVADELVRPLDGPLRDLLAGLRPDRPALVRPQLYVPTPADPAGEPNPFARLRFRRASNAELRAGKVVVPRAVGASRRHRLLQGSHAVAEVAGGEKMYAPLAPGLALAHFPVRSADQLRGKVLAGWLAHCAREDARSIEAVHWKRLFDRIARGAALDADELLEIASTYDLLHPVHPAGTPFELVHDPVPVSYTLRHATAARPEPLELAVRTAEALVEELRAGLERAGRAGRRDPVAAAG
jgi:hypothetical protein